ncbi:hypothetical protein [Streptomyces sp. NPDC060194]|uniref:hypothetical protein n=1 Tax=Streptomyces sp. NPDC060194 TaxID=3347069 RepID=UPI00366671D1
MTSTDHHAVLRARVLLLGSGPLDPAEELAAYRLLAEVSPRAYLPKLVDALLARSARDPRPALTAEAVAAARRIDPSEPNRQQRLDAAMELHRHALLTTDLEHLEDS